MDDEPYLINRQQAAKRLGICPRQFHRLRARAGFPAPTRAVGRPMWRWADLQAWVDGKVPTGNRQPTDDPIEFG
jgi:hypothetical protein